MTRLVAALISLALALWAGATALLTSGLHKITSEARDCAAHEHAVRVQFEGGRECIRYFPAGELEDARLALILLPGDGAGRNRDKRKSSPEVIRGMEQRLARIARISSLPTILIARPGTFGSSGAHRERRQIAEFRALHAAIEEIRRRYRIRRLVLLGHSGGATAAAALLTLGLDNVACAILTSGAFSLLERARLLRLQNGRMPRPGRDTTGLPSPYDPLDHVDGIIHDSNRRIILIGNPDDRVAPFAFQEAFVHALRAHGHNAQLETAPASPPNFHRLQPGTGLRKAITCAREAQP